MVTPIHIITSVLGVAFAISFLGKFNKHLAGVLMLSVLAFITFISASWLGAFVIGDLQTVQIFTAGFTPPYSISFQMGTNEAFITLVINIIGLLGGLYMYKSLVETGRNAVIVYMVVIMGLNVIVLTRDIFNLFVFMEVSSIGMAGLVILDKGAKSVAAGFKYMIASGIIAGILLLGIIFLYHLTGTLFLNEINAIDLTLLKSGSVVLFLIVIAVLLELKPFPANGWALDIYETTNPGISALLSAGTSTALLFVLFKITPMLNEAWLTGVSIAGLITFVGANFAGIKQENGRRLLGYSSIGQVGLLTMVIGFKDILGDSFNLVFVGLLLSHVLAKAGLFWISGVIKAESLDSFRQLAKRPVLLLFFGIFIFALMGIPPFPSFFGKWELVMQLSATGNIAFVAVMVLGTLFEAVYLFKWLGIVSKAGEQIHERSSLELMKVIPVFVVAAGLGALSYFTAQMYPGAYLLDFVPLAFMVVLFMLDFLPAFVKNLFTIGGISYYAYKIIPEYFDQPIMLVFVSIFLIGSILALIPGFKYTQKRMGVYPFVVLMVGGLVELVTASTSLEFFFGWEMMAIGSYLLILRGKNATNAAFRYILFSVGGAMVMLLAFGMQYAETGSNLLSSLSSLSYYAAPVYILLLLGFLSKAAGIGLHIWLPGAYSESESDLTPLLSGILIKSGVFGLMMLLLNMGNQQAGGVDLMVVLSWIGALTALMGNMLAVYQENAKKLIAYSSIGAMGYIIFALSMMSHLGWLTAMTYTINHVLYKLALFLAIGGVIYRTKTSNMYEMGGLIGKMPLSFITVLISIITLAGIPPLSGFAGKWLFYNAVITKGWYLQGTMVFFSGIVAFLYCFKLIFSVFLGMEKDHLRKVKEAPVWYILPQLVVIAGIMLFSLQPKLVLEPLGNALSVFFPDNALVWRDSKAFSVLGYWDATNIGIIVITMFGILFGWLWINSRKVKKVKQFDIVFQAEKPFTPETTHLSHNMFSAYNKSLGWMVLPYASKFWTYTSETTEALSDKIRRVYNGNGQTYAIHLILYMLFFYLVLI